MTHAICSSQFTSRTRASRSTAHFTQRKNERWKDWRGVQRDFIVYTIFYSQYMKMEGKSHVIKGSRQRSKYRNQFTQQSSHLREFNERRGDTLQVSTCSGPTGDHLTHVHSCVSTGNTRTYLGQRACTERCSLKSCLWLQAKEKQQRRPYPLYPGDDPCQTPHQEPPETHLHAHL